MSVRDQVCNHKRCYALRYKTRQKSTDTDKDEVGCSTSKKTRRSHELKFNNALCVFCQKTSKVKGALCNFATVEASETVRRCLEGTPDQLLKDRLWDVDLVAAEVKYHKNCCPPLKKVLMLLHIQSLPLTTVIQISLAKPTLTFKTV